MVFHFIFSGNTKPIQVNSLLVFNFLFSVNSIVVLHFLFSVNFNFYRIYHFVLDIMTSSQSRKPKNQVNSVVAQIKDPNEHWVATTFLVHDWIYMQPSGKGIHRVAKRKRNNQDHHWKGRIQEFKIDDHGEYLAKVQHVYTRRDILLDTAVADRSIPSHCKFQNLLCGEQFIL